ncbi:MAG: 50S ribosomal protein L11 methyltransferase [Chromatiales bacterium]|jgi:ribosomal protein L11 methyltransferase
MPWKQVSLRCSAAEVERLEAAMLDAGAVSVTLSDAGDHELLEPAPGETPLWPEAVVTGLFDAQVDLDAIEETLRPATDPSSAAEISELADREWSRVWMERFRPMRYGRRLWVCPSWRTPPEPDAVNLLLDPGLAFGTGTHATTALCLRWLDANPPLDQDVIDYGCGSGILGIAALRLGARHCAAVDLDPQALDATRENARRNGLDDCLIETCAPEALSGTATDLILANILAAPLIDLAPRLCALLRPGGRLVLSGILERQVAEVAEAYAPQLELSEPVVSDDWVLLEGSRPRQS